MDVTWRRHQRLALDALAARHAAAAAAGDPSRSWVVLPPGSGKTWVGLGVAAEALASGEATRVVVLAPTTAIQAQWVAQAAAFGLEAGDDRSLTAPLTALTYQSVAVFERAGAGGDDGGEDDPGDPDDPDEMPDLPEEADDEDDPLARLHPNGAALVERLAAAGPLLLVLDECHHLLEAWGELLVALLDRLTDARVLGLTATPRESLTRPQEEVVAALFGPVAYAASVPAVVREGDLAPFLELVWFTRPTAAERDWLAQGAERFAELTVLLEDPTFGSTPFLVWLARRLGDGGGGGLGDEGGSSVSWSSRALAEPELADAYLRLAGTGRVPLPEDAHLAEQHLAPPTVDDWMLLLEDWLRRCLLPGGLPEDEAVVEVVRRTLPAVDRVWTRNGVRRGRSVVDRVLARSEAKGDACVEIVGHAAGDLGPRLRALVLCDHERASATLPMSLRGVVDAAAGSAWAILGRLAADPGTARLRPLLVTGATVAGDPSTLADLAAAVRERDPALGETLQVEPLADDAPEVADVPLARLVGTTAAWRSRRWVREVTAFFEDGRCQVLVGTKGLLGEGWDARRVTGVVDLTSSTTSQSVVQVRGRSLRTDPSWPDKVAVNWTVTCLAPEHPQGDADWQRLVRKHRGFFGVDDAGDVVDGVAHLDPSLSPFRPPDLDALDALNARSLVRSADLGGVRDRWRVGEPYDDRAGTALRVRVRATRHPAATAGVEAPRLPVVPRALPPRDGDADVDPAGIAVPSVALTVASSSAAGLVVGALVATGSFTSDVVRALFVLLGVAMGAAFVAGALEPRRRALRDRRAAVVAARNAWADAVLAHLRSRPEPQHVAGAVADALHRLGDLPVGAEAVEVLLDADGTYRCRLRGVDEEQADLFATALDEALGRVERPRYLLRRPVLGDPGDGPEVEAALRDAVLAGGRPTDGDVWHPVPTVLGTHRRRALAYRTAWERWVGPADVPLYTGSPEGAGVLVAQHGSDPFAATAVMRRHWG